MYVVCVRVQVAPAQVSQFITATVANAGATRGEPGNLRYDVLRTADDPTRFFLYEVYRTEEDFRAHQQTDHYLRWREIVAPMMAAPRVGEKYHSIFPEPWE